MAISKRMKEGWSKIQPGKVYDLKEAVQLVKETSRVKFDASVEVHVNLGIDSKKGDQIVRASVSLPHGTGKKVRIAAFVTESDIKKALESGADIAGAQDLIEEIKKTEKCDFDIAVATPDMMKSLAAIARILGQKGLMPNPKTGTIAPNVEKIIQELKKGKISYKNDETGSLHVVCGKVSFSDAHLIENIKAFLESVKKAKPESTKGTFIKSVYITSSMGPSVRVSLL